MGTPGATPPWGGGKSSGLESEGWRSRLNHFCKRGVSPGVEGPPSPHVPPSRRADWYLRSLLLWGPVAAWMPGVLWSLPTGLPTDACVASRAHIRHGSGRVHTAGALCQLSRQSPNLPPGAWGHPCCRSACYSLRASGPASSSLHFV